MKYTVQIKEVHWSTRNVEADCVLEAIENAWDVDEIQLEYSHSDDKLIIVTDENGTIYDVEDGTPRIRR